MSVGVGDPLDTDPNLCDPCLGRTPLWHKPLITGAEAPFAIRPDLRNLKGPKAKAKVKMPNEIKGIIQTFASLRFFEMLAYTRDARRVCDVHVYTTFFLLYT